MNNNRNFVSTTYKDKKECVSVVEHSVETIEFLIPTLLMEKMSEQKFRYFTDVKNTKMCLGRTHIFFHHISREKLRIHA